MEIILAIIIVLVGLLIIGTGYYSLMQQNARNPVTGRFCKFKDLTLKQQIKMIMGGK